MKASRATIMRVGRAGGRFQPDRGSAPFCRELMLIQRNAPPGVLVVVLTQPAGGRISRNAQSTPPARPHRQPGHTSSSISSAANLHPGQRDAWASATLGAAGSQLDVGRGGHDRVLRARRPRNAPQNDYLGHTGGRCRRLVALGSIVECWRSCGAPDRTRGRFYLPRTGISRPGCGRRGIVS
jgi:hypothetical protein